MVGHWQSEASLRYKRAYAACSRKRIAHRPTFTGIPVFVSSDDRIWSSSSESGKNLLSAEDDPVAERIPLTQTRSETKGVHVTTTLKEARIGVRILCDSVELSYMGMVCYKL